MSYPTEDEKRLITRFRSRVFDILKPGEDRSDQFLIRWIRGSSGNLEKAELHIRKSFEWRRENNADEIVGESWNPYFVQNYPFFVRGKDVYGHPVVELPIGLWNIGGLMGTEREDEFWKHCIQCFELMLQRIRENNSGKQPWDFQNTQVIFIVDWGGISMNWKSVQGILKFATLFDTHYPEVMYRGIYINCSTIFPKLYGMLMPVLRDRTRRRLKMYGTRRDVWEPKIKRLIHPDQLAENYGGNLPKLY